MTEDKLCDECLLEKGKIHPTFDMRLCDACRKLSKYKLICKSTAKSRYQLTEKDMTNIDEWFEVKNPHYNRASAMKLCHEDEAIIVACRKYNCTEEELTKKQNKREKAKQEIEEIKQYANDERKHQLVLALENSGLKLRSDSSLCNGYIDGTITDWTLDRIVERMCQMKYLYDYCDFNKYFQQARNNSDRYNRDEPLFDKAERLALKACGGYPKVFPWLKK